MYEKDASVCTLYAHMLLHTFTHSPIKYPEVESACTCVAVYMYMYVPTSSTSFNVRNKRPNAMIAWEKQGLSNRLVQDYKRVARVPSIQDHRCINQLTTTTALQIVRKINIKANESP